MRNRKPVIDYNYVADGLVFATRTYRYLYVGQWSWEKTKWLEQNPDKWRRLDEDVEQEIAQLRSPVEPETTLEAGPAEPNDQKSSPDTRKDADDESVSSVGTAPEPCSPPCPPAPGDENAPSGSTQTELPRSAEAFKRENNESETGTTSLGETGRKQGRAGGRPRKKRKLSAKASKARRRLLAERMRRMRVVLDALSERPIQSYAARQAGICRKTLEYWIKHSKAGDDGYDIEHEGVTMRFHVHCEWSKEAADDKIEQVAWERAKGELYKDGLGNEVPHLYVRRPDAKMIRFLLERKRPEKWGKHPKIDTPQKTGVVLVSDTPKKPAKCPEASIKARKWKSMAAMVRKTKA